MTDRIELRGLRAMGRHGVLDEERARSQPFEIDLDLELDLRRPGRTDALDDTVDYGAVAESVRREVQGEHSDLLEHLAERIARAVVAVAGPEVEVVGVTVRKLRPPVPVDLGSAGVHIHRRREDIS